MTSLSDKVAHVRREMKKRTDDRHTCHYPGCKKIVSPAVWGCPRHWYSLPLYLRRKIWAFYRPGQEKTKTPSKEYLEVAREVQDWIAQQR